MPRTQILRAKRLLAVFCGAFLLMGSEGTPRARSFDLEYVANVSELPAATSRFELWVPLPHDDPYQRITAEQIDSPVPYTIAVAPDGNRMLHAELSTPGRSPFVVKVNFRATREEHLQSRLSGGSRLTTDESPERLRQWLMPDRLVPIDGRIKSWAKEVVMAAGAHTDLEMARAIYDHVVSTVKYDKSGKGWGRGDIYYACDARRGNCTDFHAIFIGYCRALGIPARFAIGFPLPADRGAGKIAGYHCWAEFYARGIGWVPIDASEAAKNPARREYFFGAHDENRIEFSRGRDLVLIPPQQSGPLNYFVHPYAEADGQPFAGISETVSYRDVSAGR